MTQLEMNEYLKVLESKRAELVYRHRGRAELAIEPAAGDRDPAAGTFDLDSRLLHTVRSAIERIEEDAFGICARCKLNIQPQRLAALPWAARCAECQDAEESLSNVA